MRWDLITVQPDQQGSYEAFNQGNVICGNPTAQTNVKWIDISALLKLQSSATADPCLAEISLIWLQSSATAKMHFLHDNTHSLYKTRVFVTTKNNLLAVNVKVWYSVQQPITTWYLLSLTKHLPSCRSFEGKVQ